MTELELLTNSLDMVESWKRDINTIRRDLHEKLEIQMASMGLEQCSSPSGWVYNLHTRPLELSYKTKITRTSGR